jgi:hypothetical protein
MRAYSQQGHSICLLHPPPLWDPSLLRDTSFVPSTWHWYRLSRLMLTGTGTAAAFLQPQHRLNLLSNNILLPHQDPSSDAISWCHSLWSWQWGDKARTLRLAAGGEHPQGLMAWVYLGSQEDGKVMTSHCQKPGEAGFALCSRQQTDLQACVVMAALREADEAPMWDLSSIHILAWPSLPVGPQSIL